jgi:hypothetical protein
LAIFLFYLITGLIIGTFEQGFIWATNKYYTYFKPWLDYWHIADVNFLQILYYLKNFAFLGWFFSLLLQPQVSALWIKRISISLFVIALINYLFIEGYLVYGIFNPTADAIFCFVLPMFYLWFLYSTDSKVPLSKNPYFWMSLGLAAPNLISLIFHFWGNKLVEIDFVFFAQLAIAKNGISFLGHIFLAIGFYYAPYTRYMRRKTE